MGFRIPSNFHYSMHILNRLLSDFPALHQAIDEKASADYIERLISTDNLNFVVDGMTPLIRSIKSDQFEIASLLVNKGAKVNLFSAEDGSPLKLCLDKGQIDLAALLLKKGASLTTIPLPNEADLEKADNYASLFFDLISREKDILSHPDNHYELQGVCQKVNPLGMNWLHIAAQLGNRDAAQFLIDKGINIYLVDQVGQAPIHYAAKYGMVELVDLFLSKDSELCNLQDKRDVTPLMLSAMKKKVETVRFLLDKGADPKKVNRQGISAFYYTVFAELKEPVCEYSEEKDQQVCEVLKLLVDHCGESASELLAREDEKLCLHLTIRANYREATKLLIDAKADPSACGQGGDTCIHIAACQKDRPKEILELLLSKCPHLLDSKTYLSTTPLLIATGMENLEAMAFLISKGADFRAKNSQGFNLFHLAAWNFKQIDLESKKLFDEILEKAPELLQEYNHRGQMPLQVACMAGNVETIEFFIQKGANLFERNGWGELWKGEAIVAAKLNPFFRVYNKEFEKILEAHSDFSQPEHRNKIVSTLVHVSRTFHEFQKAFASVPDAQAGVFQPASTFLSSLPRLHSTLTGGKLANCLEAYFNELCQGVETAENQEDSISSIQKLKAELSSIEVLHAFYFKPELISSVNSFYLQLIRSCERELSLKTRIEVGGEKRMREEFADDDVFSILGNHYELGVSTVKGVKVNDLYVSHFHCKAKNFYQAGIREGKDLMKLGIDSALSNLFRLLEGEKNPERKQELMGQLKEVFNQKREMLILLRETLPHFASEMIKRLEELEDFKMDNAEMLSRMKVFDKDLVFGLIKCFLAQRDLSKLGTIECIEAVEKGIGQIQEALKQDGLEQLSEEEHDLPPAKFYQLSAGAFKKRKTS